MGCAGVYVGWLWVDVLGIGSVWVVCVWWRYVRRLVKVGLWLP